MVRFVPDALTTWPMPPPELAVLVAVLTVPAVVLVVRAAGSDRPTIGGLAGLSFGATAVGLRGAWPRGRPYRTRFVPVTAATPTPGGRRATCARDRRPGRPTAGTGTDVRTRLERRVRTVSFSNPDRRGDDRGADTGASGSRDRSAVSADRLTRAEAREILGVSLTADRDEIRAAYRDRVKAVHPDNGGDRAAFVRVTAAYERLLE